MKTRTRALWTTLACALGTAGLDRLSKAQVAAALAPGQPYELIPGYLRLAYVRNPGAAFGLLGQRRWLLAVVGLLVVVAVVAYAPRLLSQNAPTRYGAALLAGGALGNAIDRLFAGRVLDFIDFSLWPWVFNVADIGIVTGVALIILGQLRPSPASAAR